MPEKRIIAKEHKAWIIDENHISIDGANLLKFVEREYDAVAPGFLAICTECYFYKYTCAGIPCTPQTRSDRKHGIWIEDKEGLKNGKEVQNGGGRQ